MQGRQNATAMRNLLQQFQIDLLYEWRSYRKMQEDWSQDERASKCMRALRTIDYESYKNVVPTHAEGTCQWLTEHEKFRDWMNEGDVACLWTTADPGCGKSVLSRFLIDVYLPE